MLEVDLKYKDLIEKKIIQRLNWMYCKAWGSKSSIKDLFARKIKYNNQSKILKKF
jgi:hypothetical protein